MSKTLNFLNKLQTYDTYDSVEKSYCKTIRFLVLFKIYNIMTPTIKVMICFIINTVLHCAN